ncbi:hypothetical protein QBC32DRAFT_131899 [Pseudoneurospora amorphoporcata]|uniref:Uncharacterized protein n=1 Tax=Pseudoneurospora amorphoporcata TaxID=241081 RepID=A0AAN6SH76_9PEZI|nr:hypothetical protein QBC32DRAFT_131899 [Pseudoneurospora amorphoporcata]
MNSNNSEDGRVLMVSRIRYTVEVTNSLVPFSSLCSLHLILHISRYFLSPLLGASLFPSLFTYILLLLLPPFIQGSPLHFFHSSLHFPFTFLFTLLFTYLLAFGRTRAYTFQILVFHLIVNSHRT